MNNNAVPNLIARLSQNRQKDIGGPRDRSRRLENRSSRALVVTKNCEAILKTRFLKMTSEIDFCKKSGKSTFVQKSGISVKFGPLSGRFHWTLEIAGRASYRGDRLVNRRL
jgi:hypothetical protein